MQLQAQKFGVVKGSYRATPLPRLKTFQASLHLRADPLNATMRAVVHLLKRA